MKVVKKESDFGVNIFLQDGNKHLSITFGGTGDLYWSIHSNDVNKDNDFTITKENYNVYVLFEQLFNDIENINILYEEVTEEKKKKYKLYNYANYNELYNENENTITWYSDETAHDVANILKIKKENDSFRVQFYIQPPIEGYDEDFHSLHYIPIRFRNSGSSYAPFNRVFMKMYDEMKEINDVNDIGHQIHIEEYLYNNKVKKLIK